MSTSFEFKQCVGIPKSTGRKARSLRELRDIIADVSGESLYRHTYQYFLKGHIREYTNDFAHWVGESLEERALSEHLSNIDPYIYKDPDGLRSELLKVIDDYLASYPEPREAMPGSEFFFNESLLIVFPAGLRARNLAEFLIAIRYVETGSLFYHFYEARIRLGAGTDDFSRWFEDVLKKEDLAAKIRAIDPFMHNLEGIRQHIIDEIEQELQRDMEASGVEP